MLERFKKEKPFSGFGGFGGGGLNLSGGSGGDTLTLTSPGGGSFTFQGSGLGSACSTTNRLLVTGDPNLRFAFGDVDLMLSFSSSLSTITEFEFCVAATDSEGNDADVRYRFDGGSYTTSSYSGTSNTVIDLTSAAQSAAPFTTFELLGINTADVANWYLYVSYIKINGVYYTGTGSGSGNTITFPFSA